MGQITLPGNPPIDVILRRSARARNISLRLSQLDGRVTLTLPPRVPQQEAVAFAREKESWLRQHMSRQGTPDAVQIGSRILLRGAEHVVQAGDGRQIMVTNGEIHVPGAPDTVAARLRGFLKEQARHRLTQASDRYSVALGRPYNRITLRDTRSRWGSCTSQGALMYSWRLILAPDAVLDYVAAHEVAHLQHMDHSNAFWETVTQLYGPWKAQRRWLRDHGAGLHHYRFGD